MGCFGILFTQCYQMTRQSLTLLLSLSVESCWFSLEKAPQTGSVSVDFMFLLTIWGLWKSSKAHVSATGSSGCRFPSPESRRHLCLFLRLLSALEVNTIGVGVEVELTLYLTFGSRRIHKCWVRAPLLSSHSWLHRQVLSPALGRQKKTWIKTCAL